MKLNFSSLKKANQRTALEYPGESDRRQPVHVVYGGAHLFAADTAKKLGQNALKSLHQYAPEPASFAAAFGMPASLARLVHPRVESKLSHEPVEDLRIDFEDGFGHRPDEEEDHFAVKAAEETAKGLKAGQLPPFIGIRVKSLSNELHQRSLRTLDLFLTTLVKRAGKLPENFIVTLPKLVNDEQPKVLDQALTALEKRLKLAKKSISIELMIETTQSITTMPSLVYACGGRCTGAHFGTYDYTAACQITAAHQRMDHEACDFAKNFMQVALAGTGVFLSDGATNVMPVGAHRAGSGALSNEQIHENVLAVHRAWRLQYGHVRHSLSGGFYQGWDLHPAQLPARYAAVYSFFLENLPAASSRLKNFIEKAAQATMVGDVFDDAATGQGLLNYFLRGLNCGAISREEAEATGLTRQELQSRSFLKILEGRRGRRKK